MSSLKISGKLISSALNVARSLINPLFVALFSLLFIRLDQEETLHGINQILVAANAFLVVTGWGLKDYLIKEAASDHRDLETNWNLSLQSKLLIMVLLLLTALPFFPLEFFWLMVLIVILRTVNQHFEPLLIFHPAKKLLLIIELVFTAVILALVASGRVSGTVFFLLLILAFELVRLVTCTMVFDLLRFRIFSLSDMYLFLFGTRYFFLIALVSFFQSRIDLYVLAATLKKSDLNIYQILSAFISFSFIVISAFVAPFSHLHFRQSGSGFRKVVLKSGLVISALSALCIWLLMNYFYFVQLTLASAFIIFLNILLFTAVLFYMYDYTKHNMVRRSFVFVLISGFLNFGLSLLIITGMGIAGALISNTAGTLLLALLLYFNRKTGKDFSGAVDSSGNRF